MMLGIRFIQETYSREIDNYRQYDTEKGAVALDDLIIWARPLFHALKTAFLLYIFYILYLWAYFNKPIELSTLIQIFYFKIQNL